MCLAEASGSVDHPLGGPIPENPVRRDRGPDHVAGDDAWGLCVRGDLPAHAGSESGMGPREENQLGRPVPETPVKR